MLTLILLLASDWLTVNGFLIITSNNWFRAEFTLQMLHQCQLLFAKALKALVSIIKISKRLFKV